MFVNEGWTISSGGYQGGTAAKAPSTLGQNEVAKLALTVHTTSGGLLTFRLNSELVPETGERITIYDNDGNVILNLPAPTFEYVSFQVTIPPERSTIKWFYHSGSQSSGEVWVDNIVVTPNIVDGFESGDFTALPWIVDEGWTVDGTDAFEGDFSAHFPPNESVGLNGYRNLTLEMDTLTGGVFSFAIHSDARMPYDRLGVIIDGTIFNRYQA